MATHTAVDLVEQPDRYRARWGVSETPPGGCSTGTWLECPVSEDCIVQEHPRGVSLTGTVADFVGVATAPPSTKFPAGTLWESPSGLLHSKERVDVALMATRLALDHVDDGARYRDVRE